MKTILFANARNEENILEWVVHHLNLGFDHIFLVDHRSDIPLKFVLRFIPFDKLTIYRMDGNIIKMNLMHAARAHAKKEGYDWMAYLDCDEFLILNQDADIKDFLAKYEQYDQVGINWLCFGTNNLDTFKGNIIENFTRCHNTLDLHIKTFLHLTKPNTDHYVIYNPHSFILNDLSNSVGVDFKPLNPDGPHFFENMAHFNDTPAYIAHYLYQSYDRYIARKINLPRDDTNTFREVIPKEELDKQYNVVENLGPLNKYNKINTEMIKKYSQ
ncbi:glycosyl transferase family 2 [Fadolivirus algeromassiliense]|jgi:hypothetical protein|uniref:Glycosyl transferase family 2 n=1 Tax=Fadolivirus FV1/VV64 TaxID=3070911 RepID=A0A7D3QV87_9VIRU|nr:glycosyl transferase family 2 [Fadolivirus algeromassiliense]QKF94825.1 glycosyl transferase family 2 [Fadolivirus FV1/VV64]